MRSKFYSLVLVLLALTVGTAFAQDKVVSGTVSSADDGLTMPGVTVVVKGTTIGTLSDGNGAYSIRVPLSAKTLVYSYVGMKTEEVEIQGRSVINVSLNAGIELNEVVVTAIGIQTEKRKLSYSVQSVEANQVTQAQETNIVQALASKAAGVQVNSSTGSPGGSSAIRIRGNASIEGDNSPLFVIDGIPIDNNEEGSANPDEQTNQFLSGVANSNRAIDINPNDIETITVLKGGAATALYGIRAGNGVILITTKKGTNTYGKPRINFSSRVQMDQHNGLPGRQTRYAQGSAGVYAAPGFVGIGGFDPLNSGSRDRHSWGPDVSSLRYANGSKGVYLWDPNGKLVDQGDQTAGSQMANVYDNDEDFFQTGVTYDNNLSIQAGGEKTNFYFSVGNRSQEGIVPNSTFRRTSFKATAQSQLTNKFKATASVIYTNSGGSRQQQGSNLSGVMLGLMRTPVTFDNSFGFGADAVDNEDAYFLAGTPGWQRGYRGASNLGGPQPYAIYDNPFFTVSENSFTDKVNRTIGYVQGEYDLFDWLTAVYRVGGDFYNDRKKTIMESGSLDLGNGDGFIAQDDINNFDVNSDLYFLLNKDFGDISLGARVGHNFFSHQWQRAYAQGADLAVPGFYHLDNTVTKLVRNNQSNYKTEAGYVSADIGFRDYAFLNLTGRMERSSTLPEENNSFPFYSAGLALDITEIAGIQNDWLSYLKIRGSVSQIGNDAKPYRTNTTLGVPNPSDGWVTPGGLNFPYLGVPALTYGDLLGNSTLEPEKINSFEVGADVRLIKNRIGLDIAYYKNTSIDQIIDVPVAPSSGYREVALNAGEIVNKGWEISLTGTPVRSGDFSWNFVYNFTANKNEVVALADGVDVITLLGFASTSSRAIVGQSYGAIYGQTWATVDGAPLADDFSNRLIGADGYPNLDPDSKYLGDPNPDFILGLTNTLNYQGFSLSFLFEIKEGGEMWNGTRGALTTMGTSESTANRGEMTVFAGKTADGNTNAQSVALDEGWYRGTGGGFSGNAIDFVQETSWMRLRNLSLSYAFPRKIMDKTPFEGLSLSVSARNLWLETDYEGVDPETSLTGSGNGSGALDYFNMPGTKSFTFGLNLNL